MTDGASGEVIGCQMRIQPHKQSYCKQYYKIVSIDHFTVVRWVSWPLNDSEAGGDLLVITEAHGSRDIEAQNCV